jgi:hypothetical protein
LQWHSWLSIGSASIVTWTWAQPPAYLDMNSSRFRLVSLTSA